MATYPADGDGMSCPSDAGPDCGVPRDASIELRFDRYLLPKTAIRQSLRVFSGDPHNQLLLAPTYDALERVAIYRLAPGITFEPGLVYEVQLALPDEDENGNGFRAFDGAPLAEGNVPLRFSFRTSTSPVAVPDPAGASAGAPSCDDVLALFLTADCARAGCHVEGSSPPMGLRLDSGAALRQTAIARVAHETDVGAPTGRVLVDPPRFGTGMAIIDAGRSASSYLLYKLLLNPANFGQGADSCTSSHRVPLPDGECLPGSDAERARLAGAFVLGDPMPPSSTGMGVDNLRKIRDFIDYGAKTADCSDP